MNQNQGGSNPISGIDVGANQMFGASALSAITAKSDLI
jgi:hypothetical protein